MNRKNKYLQVIKNIILVIQGAFLVTLLFSCNKENLEVEPGSYAEVVNNNISRYQILFENLDLDYPGLENVKIAHESDQPDLALELLFDYFKQNPAGKPIREEEITPININQPILDYLKDTYTYFGVTAKIPRKSNDVLDWKYIPSESTQEFTHYINRFVGLSHWIRASCQTRNEIWIDFLNETLVDFVVSNPYRADRLPQPLETECRGYEFGGNNNYPWLILNAGVRAREFPKAFYQMLEHDLMQPETFLLLLSSIEEHADYLYSRGGFNGDNWDNINLSALLKISLYLPEFKRSRQFKEASTRRYYKNLRQVWYNDGSQWELATHYGFVVLNNCMTFLEIAKDADVDIPTDIMEMLEKQIFYMAVTTNPNGEILPLNDSNPNENPNKKLIEFAKQLNLSHALFLVSNGEEGTLPNNPASRFFEYSGNLISRDSWINTQHFSSFDFGPFGMGHNHADKLSLNIFNGRSILVDPGRFIYGSNNSWAEFRMSTRAHNTISIDGADQKMLSNNGAAGLPGAIDDYLKNNPRNFLETYDMARENPIPNTEFQITEDHDFAKGTVFTSYEGNGFQGEATHQRAVWYQRGKFWLVLDEITSGTNRKVESFWHFHPNCKQVEITENGAVFSKDPGVGNVIIVPIEGTVLPTATLVKGQESPEVQGWYSPEYGKWEPSYDAVYSANIGNKANFAWLIVPFNGTLIPQASAKILSNENNTFEIEVSTGDEIRVIKMQLNEQGKF